MAATPVVSNAENWCKTDTNVVSFSYKWIITNFSKRPEATSEKITSSTFSANYYDEHKFCLNLYPNGDSERRKNFIALFLELQSPNSSVFSFNIKADFSFSLLNDKSEETNSKIKRGTRFSNGLSSGTSEYIDRNFVLNVDNGLLPNDTLTIKCDVWTTFDTVTNSDQKMLVNKSDCDCKLSHDLGQLFENAKLKDVTFLVGNCEIQAHKSILAARSTVFDAMFGHEMEESKSNRVSIADIRFEVIQEMLRFIYTGKVLSLASMAEELLMAAEKYALNELKVLCELELCSKLSVETAADMLILADLHNAGKLKAQTIDFINAHVVEVLQTQGWKNMIASHKDLVMEAVEAIATWNGPPRKRTKN